MTRSSTDTTSEVGDARWHLWERGEAKLTVDPVQPLLASWEASTHPAQIRLGEYLDRIETVLSPLPEDAPLFLHMDVDVCEPERLLHHYDLENYLTPLFGSRCLPHKPFVLASARKYVGGGSRIHVGIAKPAEDVDDEGWGQFCMNAGSGATYPEWKKRIHDGLASSGAQVLPDGPVRARLAWRCSSQRNWTSLWKPTGDAMGPVLGVPDPARLFHLNDDRIVDLALHLEANDEMGHDVLVGMWWQQDGAGRDGER